MKIGELFIALGFDVDDKKLKEFNTNVADGLKGLLKISAAAAGAVYAVNAFVAGSVAGAVSLQNFNLVTGESIDELQKWQIAATAANPAMGIDQVTESVKALNGAIADVSMGKGPSGPFAMLGIDTKGKDAFAVLEEMRARFDQNVSEWGLPQTIKLMQETGIDPGLINSIKMTRQEFDLLLNGRIMDPESRARLVALGETIASVKMDLKFFKDQLVADYSPKLIEFLTTAGPLLKEFGTNIKTAFNFMGEKAGPALDYITDKLEPFTGWLVVAGGLIAAAFAPVTATFLALVYLTNEWGKALRGLPAFQGIKDTAQKMFDWVGENSKDLLVNEYDAEKNPYGWSGRPTPDGYESLFYPGGKPTTGMPPQPAPIQNTVEQSNTFHISGAFDPNEVAEEVARLTQGQLNVTLDDFNNGPRF